MIQNRFFKTLMGYFAEVFIATAADIEEVTATGGAGATAVIPVTIGASPTIGDFVEFDINGTPYRYTVPGGGATTQQAHDGILALLQGAGQDLGFDVAAHSGTTSSSYTLVFSGGAEDNGKTVTLTETGATFTVAAPVVAAGGVDADAAAADTVKAFVAGSNPGTIWAFWTDTNKALVAGDTSNPDNARRSFYYLMKQADGLVKQSTPVQIKGLEYNSVAYNAGTAQVRTATFGGTFSLGQIIHVRIIETTGTLLPFPTFSYYSKIGSGGINGAVLDLKNQINEELSKNEPVVTATNSTNVLTLTAVAKNRSFKVVSDLEVTAAQPTDASEVAFAETVKPLAAIGDVASITELERYAKTNAGAIEYPNSGLYNAAEFNGAYFSNIDSTGATQYGILLVKNLRIEKGGAVDQVLDHQAYIVIAVKNADLAKLAAL